MMNVLVCVLAFSQLLQIGTAQWTPTAARQISLTNGWYDNYAVTYYDFGMAPQFAADIFLLFTANGAAVAGQHNIVDQISAGLVVQKNVSDPGYSPFWRVNKVTVNNTYVANTFKSLSDLTGAVGVTIVPTTVIINCPLVPAGSTLLNDPGSPTHPVSQGWYRGNPIFYFSFETNDQATATAANLVYAPGFGSGTTVYVLPIYITNPPGGAVVLAGQLNVIESFLGDAGYSPLWQVTLSTPPAGSTTFRTSHLDMSNAGWTFALQANNFVNCPLVGTKQPLGAASALTASWYLIAALSATIAITRN